MFVMMLRSNAAQPTVFSIFVYCKVFISKLLINLIANNVCSLNCHIKLMVMIIILIEMI